MIDPIGMKPGTLQGRPAATTEPVDPVAATPTVSRHATAATAGPEVRSLARELAASPPVDHDRVERIKRAIAEGTFPIVPAQIADRLIAAQLDWIAE